MANARLVFRTGSGSSALLRCPASASALGRASRLARIVCHAIWRMLVWSFMREAEAAPSCGALHPLRPLSGPRVLHDSFVLRYGECSFGLSCGKRKQRPLAVPCIRFGPWAGLALHESFVMRYGECSFGAFVREAEAAPSCGALHPLRPLSGPRVLQTAAPKISPCFCRWQRSKF